MAKTKLVPVAECWNAKKDTERLVNLIHKACLYQHHAALTCKDGRYDEATALLRGMMELRDLLEVFRAYPHLGVEKIGRTLRSKRRSGDLSRNGVYFRLSQVGLKTDDLRNPKNSLYNLVLKSNVLGPVAKKIKRAKLPQTIAPQD